MEGFAHDSVIQITSVLLVMLVNKNSSSTLLIIDRALISRKCKFLLKLELIKLLVCAGYEGFTGPARCGSPGSGHLPAALAGSTRFLLCGNRGIL